MFRELLVNFGVLVQQIKAKLSKINEIKVFIKCAELCSLNVIVVVHRPSSSLSVVRYRRNRCCCCCCCCFCSCCCCGGGGGGVGGGGGRKERMQVKFGSILK